MIGMRWSRGLDISAFQCASDAVGITTGKCILDSASRKRWEAVTSQGHFRRSPRQGGRNGRVHPFVVAYAVSSQLDRKLGFVPNQCLVGELCPCEWSPSSLCTLEPKLRSHPTPTSTQATREGARGGGGWTQA